MPGNVEYRHADQREHVERANQGKSRLALVVLLVAALLAFVLAAVTLLTGRPWLGDPTRLFGIQAGNLVAWVLHLTLPFAAWLALRHRGAVCLQRNVAIDMCTIESLKPVRGEQINE